MRDFNMTNLRWLTRYFVRWPTCTLKMTNWYFEDDRLVLWRWPIGTLKITDWYFEDDQLLLWRWPTSLWPLTFYSFDLFHRLLYVVYTLRASDGGQELGDQSKPTALTWFLRFSSKWSAFIRVPCRSYWIGHMTLPHLNLI